MDCDAYIARWSPGDGGAERANYQMFLSELCDVIDAPRPDPAASEREHNDYVFERAVRRRDSDDIASWRRIDLYKRGCFILEAKQSRLPGAHKALPVQPSLFSDDPNRVPKPTSPHVWDAMMRNARSQAEQYVFLLEPDHPAPPFLIICDVGHVFEIYADFSGTGRAYSQFPDRNSHRITLQDLRREEIRERLRAIWSDPLSLDPARRTARVTRDVAQRLAAVSRSLEQQNHPEEVALFLMRCIFCMFAEDVDLVPKGEFTRLLEDAQQSPDTLVPLLGDLWKKMDTAERNDRFFSYFCTDVRYFNGNLYRDARVLPLQSEAIGELVAAARHTWIDVDPAIFGTLLEQALNPAERRKLGAHYTPRAYVERLVEATILDVLRAEWRSTVKLAEDAKERKDERGAIALAQAFHRRLCAHRVLDPACGTGNFLYVSLEMMKRLEGEVLETLAQLGVNEVLGLDYETVGPHQFLGLEVNPRAAAIAELVIWIGYLQQHYRTRSGHPSEPILRAFANINGGQRCGQDALIAWDGSPKANAQRATWPDAEFIVGNPPFLGGKDLRSRLGDAYAEALWKAHPQMNESADLVMYWWDHAAELLTRKGSSLKRFGLVTTNSISQVFQRRTIERHLNARHPVSIIMAIPDHPWTKATKDSVAVRIAMTVVEAGKKEGTLMIVSAEKDLDTEAPQVELKPSIGLVRGNLALGPDLDQAKKLDSTLGLCSRGVVLHGAGFQLTPATALKLGLGQMPELARRIRPYRNGRDITNRPRGNLVIDLYGMRNDQVRARYPAVYQHLLEHVKPERDGNPRRYRRENWWLFGENVPDARSAWSDLTRYIATVETAKHRVFQFLDAEILPDNMVVAVATDDASLLAVLSSRIHVMWSLASGATLEDRPRYSKSRCFDPFPFPDTPPAIALKLRSAGEELDALRKQVINEHPDLTLTGLYNVLEKLKSGEALSPKEHDVKQRGLILILRDLHETIDGLTSDAYGWPRHLGDEEIIGRLVALNKERTAEEAEGHVRWLRPDYQIPRFAKQPSAKTKELDLGLPAAPIAAKANSLPKERELQLLTIESVINRSGSAMDAATVARTFRNGGRKIEPRVAQMLQNLAIYGHISALPDGRYVGRQHRP